MVRPLLACLSPILVLQAAGCASVPTSPGCGSDDRAVLPAEARRSLEVRAFEGTALHDAGGRAFEPAWPDGVAGGDAVVSWPDPGRFPEARDASRLRGRSYLYDDALLALDRIRRGDQEGAARTLRLLAALQRPDGAWGFSLGLDDGFYDAGYVRAGTVAFCVYAFAKYALAFDDHRFRASAGRGADWLLASREPATGLILAGLGRWDREGRVFSPAYVADFAATEHQIDAFFALAALGEVDPGGPWSAEAVALAGVIVERLWDEEEGRFVQGLSPRGPDRGSALDAAGTWGALFHLAVGRPDRSLRCLRWVESHHATPSGLKPWGDGPDLWFVEGSVAHALAWYRLAPKLALGRESLGRVRALACAEGLPLLYANRWAVDFPMAPAAAPTLWFLLAADELEAGGAPFLWSERLHQG